MRTIGHHTCKQDGGIDFVRINSPFYAEHSKDEDKYQFLGSGYYFWDDNIELAKTWGKYHYHGRFCIFQFDFELTEDNCLDLVGNRRHQQFFMKLFKSYEEETEDKREDWSICQCIEFLKELRKRDSRIFPFTMIRAIDLFKHTEYKQQFLKKFVGHKENYTVINPKMVICVINRDDVPLHSKKMIHWTI